MSNIRCEPVDEQRFAIEGRLMCCDDPMLHSAAGFIRREVGRRVRLRLTPELEFHWDPGMENVEQVAQLLDKLKAAAPEPPAPAEADDADAAR